MEKKTRYKTNMGFLDRMVRLCAGFGLILVGALAVHGTIGTILLIVGILAVLTSAIGFCPAYVPFGISTEGFPFGRPELMSKMISQCCGDAKAFSGCCGIMERSSGTSGETQAGQDQE